MKKTRETFSIKTDFFDHALFNSMVDLLETLENQDETIDKKAVLIRLAIMILPFENVFRCIYKKNYNLIDKLKTLIGDNYLVRPECPCKVCKDTIKQNKSVERKSMQDRREELKKFIINNEKLIEMEQQGMIKNGKSKLAQANIIFYKNFIQKCKEELASIPM